MSFGKRTDHLDRRSSLDRRQGLDTRSREDILIQGERRIGGDRRARGKRNKDSAGSTARVLLYAAIGLATVCIVDIRLYDGQHTLRVASDAGSAAAYQAGRWVGGGFGR